MSAKAKFGPGKYKTRDGQDVEIVAVVKGVAIGYFIEEGVHCVHTWSAETGQFDVNSTMDDSFDLIDPNAKKPIKFEKIITLYPQDGGLEGYRVGGLYDTLKDAKKNRCPGCIAIAKAVIEGMEGDGLDGSSDGDSE